jgi:hypothetical protein
MIAEHKRLRIERRVLPALFGAIYLAVVAPLVAQHLRTIPDPAWPVTHGTVEKYRVYRVFILNKHADVSVKIVGTETVVKATLTHMDKPEQFPREVSFRFSGDSSREVRLLEQSSPWLIVSIFTALWLMTLIAFPLADRLSSRAVDGKNTHSS